MVFNACVLFSRARWDLLLQQECGVREGNRQREWLRDVGREGVGGVKKGEGDWMKTGQYLTLQF